MGFYLRKSVSVGPFRFNISKSGVGVSAGIKGLRVGAGPRGNYIHMGRGGLYYRKTFAPAGAKSVQPLNQPQPIPAELLPTSPTHDPMQAIESGDITRLVDSSSKELVDEINSKQRMLRLWPFAAGASLALLYVLSTLSLPGWGLALAALSLLALTAYFAYHDTLSKTVVMLYQIEDQYEKITQDLHDAFEEMSKSHSAWHVAASAKVRDRKYHAGASSLVERSSVDLSLKPPPFIKTNVATPCIPVGKQTLYFFPDRVLVFEPSGVGAVSYENLSIDVSSKRFIEDGSVPKDAQIVDRTWAFINKSGGPDRRFKNNRELPIALYEEVHLRSQTGLNECIQLSRHGIAHRFSSAIMRAGCK